MNNVVVTVLYLLRALHQRIRGVTIRYPHDTIRIAIHGSRYDTYRDTWVTVRYVSRYMGHGTIRIAIHGSRYDTYRDTWVTVRYVSRYMGHGTIRIAIHGSRYDTYRDTWVTVRYVSRYMGHGTIRIAIQGMTLATGPLARGRFSAAGPVGPQACIFPLARWATRQQIGPPVGLEDTGPTPLVALFAKPTQTTDSHQCIDGYLSPCGCSAWLCLALSLMTQLCPVNYVAA